MLVRILISLAVAVLATNLAPVLSDQAPSVPHRDIYNALPRVMAPGSGDSPSSGVIVLSTIASGRGWHPPMCWPSPSTRS